MLASEAAWRGEPGSPAASTSEGRIVDPGLLEAIRCAVSPDVLISAEVCLEQTQQSPTDGELLRRTLSGLVTAPAGYRLEPLAYGRHKRAAPQALFTALMARDHGCVYPWCDRPPSWCQAHHVLEFDADDGPTDVDTMALICFPHHTRLHRQGDHLHPPWCACLPCTAMASQRWRLRRTTPLLTTRAGVLSYQPRVTPARVLL